MRTDLGMPTTLHSTLCRSHSSWIAFAAALPPAAHEVIKHVGIACGFSHSAYTTPRLGCLLITGTYASVIKKQACRVHSSS